MEDIKFRRKLRSVGNGSLSLTIPPEMVEYLNFKEGIEIIIRPDKDQKRKYGYFYKE